MFFLLLLITSVKPIDNVKNHPIAKVEQNYITNIDEICGMWYVDNQGNRSREGYCYIPKNTPIIVDKQIFTGLIIIREEETDTIRTYIGKTKKKLILWMVLV